MITLKKLHIVFPDELLEPLKEELESDGYEVVNTDGTLDTFAQWAETKEPNHADCAIINGLAVAGSDGTTSQKQMIYDYLRTVRMNREQFRLIVIFPYSIQTDKDFVSKISQLMIYDIYFTDDLHPDEMIKWIEEPKGFSHVSKILDGYKSHDKSVIKEDIKVKVEKEEDEEIKQRKEKEKKESRLIKQIQSISQRNQQDIRTVYRSFASKSIVITSMKGGVGKTDLAINLAAALKEHTNVNKLCVVDFDFPYGGLASALHLTRTSDLGDWMLKETDRITEEGIKSKVINHEGIDFIPMTLNIRDGQEFQELHSEIMIDILKRYYDIVIIDTSGFTKPSMVAIERASEVIILTTHDVVSISTAVAYKEDLINLHGIDYNKISLFINQVPKVEDIKKEEIAAMFEDQEDEVTVIGYAPFDDEVRQTRNKGEIIYLTKPSHPFSIGVDMVLSSLDIVSSSVLEKRQRKHLYSETKKTIGGFISKVKLKKGSDDT